MRSALRDARAALDRAPTVASPAVMARATGASYVVTDVFSLSALLSQWHEVARPWAGVGFITLALVAGVVIWRRGRDWPVGAYHALVALATGLVTASIVVCPGGATAVAMSSMYALTAILASFLFPLRLSLRHVAGALVAGAVALRVSGGVTVAEYVLVAGELVIASGVAGWLTRAAADSEVDVLSGLANRRGLGRVLDAQLAQPHQGAGLVLAMIDIDYFKAVNDAAGHAEGDRVLREAVSAWRVVLDGEHLLARVGGDEFALVMRDLDRDAADAVAERLRLALGEMSCTIGLARWERGDSAAMLLGRADAALYSGKRSGRNRVCWHDSATGALSEPLHEALRSGQLQVHYQPIVDLATGWIKGAEALLRWPDGAGGWHPPAGFIPVAEATGLIREVGEWVLRRACADAQGWVAEGAELEKLSVNVSPVQLQEAGFPALVRAVLDETGLDPQRLVLEVTESALGGEGARSVQGLAALRALGVRVAIDDFGTGYSTLSRLRDVPVDVLKIDRSFVATLGQERSHAPIVGAVVALAGALGLRTVAEGAETPEQVALLRQLGCTEVQGFVYSPAVPSADLLGMWPHRWPVSGPAAGQGSVADPQRQDGWTAASR